MKLSAFLRKTTSIPKNIINYLQTRGKRRLYQQWIEQADLPPEAVPREEPAKDLIPRIDKKRFRVYMLFMLLGAALVVVCGGVIFLILHSC